MNKWQWAFLWILQLLFLVSCGDPDLFYYITTEVYLKPSQTPMMKLFRNNSVLNFFEFWRVLVQAWLATSKKKLDI